jgi:hypothetical protein
MATQYQKRMLMRKSSDLTRLAEQFKKNIEASTGEYESSFADYQKNVAAQMAPYEAAIKQYKEVASPAYEAAIERYNQEFENYKSALSAWEEKPYTTEIKKSASGGRYLLEIPIPMPTFNQKAPSAPTAPQAPQVAGFDEAKFEQKRGQLQQEFQREVGERKGARLAVVGRRGARPLLEGQK